MTVLFSDEHVEHPLYLSIRRADLVMTEFFVYASWWSHFCYYRDSNFMKARQVSMNLPICSSYLANFVEPKEKIITYRLLSSRE